MKALLPLCHIPEDSTLYTHCNENLISHTHCTFGCHIEALILNVLKRPNCGTIRTENLLTRKLSNVSNMPVTSVDYILHSILFSLHKDLCTDICGWVYNGTWHWCSADFVYLTSQTASCHDADQLDCCKLTKWGQHSFRRSQNTITHSGLSKFSSMICIQAARFCWQWRFMQNPLYK